MIRDLRDFISFLEGKNELVRVRKPVSAEYEIGAICRIVCDSGGPALLFENVKGYTIPLLVNLWSSWRRVALQFETTQEALLETCMSLMERKLSPRSVSTGPCKEVVLKGDEVDLTKLPIPTWHEGEGGPYITLGVYVTKDPELGLNCGVYRTQVKGKNRLTAMILQLHGRHVEQFYERARQRGEEKFEVAIAIGADPFTTYVAGNHLERPQLGNPEKFAIAGALRKEPIELVKCETVDLEVPSLSEIVIEGYIPIGEYENEGPFTEGSGYQSSVQKIGLPVVVTAITHRRNPIFHAAFCGKPPSESKPSVAILDMAVALKTLRERFPMLKTIYCPHGAGEGMYILQIDEKLKLHTMIKNLLLSTAFTMPYTKIVVAVDDDVNIYDLNDVLWAITRAVRPERDIEIVSGGAAHRLDPSVGPEGIVGKVFIDATKKPDFRGRLGRQPKQVMEYVKEHWEEYKIALK